MKRLLIGMTVVALMGLLAVPAVADTPGKVGPVDLDVNITVESYCEIDVGASIDLTLNAGNCPAGLLDFTVRTNDSVQIALTTNDPIYSMHKEGTSTMNPYPCALLDGGSYPDDGLGYWPQLKAVKEFVGGADAGLTLPTGYGGYTEGGGGEHGGEIWQIIFWNSINEDIKVNYSGGGTFNGQVGYDSNIANTRTGDFAVQGSYRGSMTITLTCGV